MNLALTSTTILLSTCLAWTSLPIYASLNGSSSQVAFEHCDYKKAIQTYREWLTSADKENIAALKVKLAITLYKDQEHEQSFSMFLEALEETLNHASSQITPEEQNLYTEGLELYLHRHGMTSWEIAAKIRQNYAETIKQHPDYHLLGFLVAAAYANLEQFEQFFELFYHSYRYFPNHYMAYKTKAVLHAKLLERARSAAEREKQRLEIFNNLSSAVKLNPQDTTLYKMIIAAASDERKEKIVNAYLNKMMDEDIIVPRSDIIFYVEQAVKSKQADLAQSFINKVRIWYPTSRIIDHAQQYIRSQMFQEKGLKNE